MHNKIDHNRLKGHFVVILPDEVTCSLEFSSLLYTLNEGLKHFWFYSLTNNPSLDLITYILHSYIVPTVKHT